MNVLCPLTKSSNVELVKEYSVEVIVHKWRNAYGIDISHIFDGIESISLYECKDSFYRFFYPFSLEADSGIYEKLMELPWYYQEEKWEYEMAKAIIPSKGKMLEVGCGDGKFMEYVASPLLDITGLELNVNAVKIASEKSLDVRGESLESWCEGHSKEYDIVVAFQVLEHISNSYDFIDNCLRLLKPGGRLILSVPDNDSFYRWDPDNSLNLPPHHMAHWTKNAFESLDKVFSVRSIKCITSPLEKVHLEWYVRLILKKTPFHARKSVVELGVKVLDSMSFLRKCIRGHSMLAILEK